MQIRREENTQAELVSDKRSALSRAREASKQQILGSSEESLACLPRDLRDSPLRPRRHRRGLSHLFTLMLLASLPLQGAQCVAPGGAVPGATEAGASPFVSSAPAVSPSSPEGETSVPRVAAPVRVASEPSSSVPVVQDDRTLTEKLDNITEESGDNSDVRAFTRSATQQELARIRARLPVARSELRAFQAERGSWDRRCSFGRDDGNCENRDQEMYRIVAGINSRTREISELEYQERRALQRLQDLG